ncbi:MAG: lytic transglycosylase domain-containing protein [Deltaproteobacteria bacterium]|jgi:soluble lytic murein transglycosylase-like protein|nr:lytic transglycosylase domain-containing protein [Deltaproteobacteria bacterium]
MFNLTLTKLVFKFGLNVIMAVACVSLATAVAHMEHNSRLEHQARLDLVLPQTLAADTQETAPSVMEPDKEPLIVGLSPNYDLLDQVVQASTKPLFDRKSSAYEQMIDKAARKYRISPALVKAVIQTESNFNSRAVSAQGAVGLMQILPSTARSMGISSPLEPYNNITAGVRYLKMLLEEFGNDEYLAVAAYNCGPEAIKRYGGKMPPYNETKIFVRQVMHYYQSHIES